MRSIVILLTAVLATPALAASQGKCPLQIESLRDPDTVADAVQSGACTDADVHALVAANAQWLTAAVQKIEVACDGGDAASCHDLAQALATGKGLRRDVTRAMKLFGKLCDKGDGDSCSDLGLFSLRGWDVPQDFKRAATLINRGCKLKSQTACQNVARLPKNKGDQDRLRQARDTAKTIEDRCRKTPSECMDLFAALWNGDGVPKSRTLAIRLVDLACEKGETNACELLGRTGP